MDDLLFAGLAVADWSGALDFYGRLFGRPPDLVAHEHEVLWRLSDRGWVVLLHDPERAGRSFCTVARDEDLDTTLDALAGRGIPRPEVAVIEAGRKAEIRDPEGNAVTFIQVAG